MRFRICLPVVASVSLLLYSCAGRTALRMEKLESVIRDGDYLTAIAEIKKNPKLYGKNSSFLFYMDIGVLFHYAGLYDSSTVYLQRAADIHHELFARSVTNEAAAVMVNDLVRPYRSKPYEIVLMHQIIALNYLVQGMTDEALVETRRVQLLFDEWDRKDKSETKYSSDPMFHFLSSIAYDAAGEFDNAAISLFKSIQAFQSGPLQLPSRIKDYAYYQLLLNGRSSDVDLLKLKADLPESDITELGNNQSEIVIIGYGGKGPALDENIWSGTYIKDGYLVLKHTAPNGTVETISTLAPPLPETQQEREKGEKTSSGTTFHIKIALPAMKMSPSKTASFSVRCSGTDQVYKSVVINDLEKQLQKYLLDTRSATVARTTIRVVLRTIASQRAKASMQTENPFANLLLNIGTDVLTDQLERADTRSCFLIPQTVQIVRIPVKPGTYTLDIAAHDKSGAVINNKEISGISVKSREKKFIIYSSFK
jgi:hypothetical protein